MINALQEKLPNTSRDRRDFHNANASDRFKAFQTSEDEVKAALKPFPNGSYEGPDFITLQHLRDLTDTAGKW